MTPHERYLAFMRYQPVDRPPLCEWGAWPSTLRRWRKEGMPPCKETPEMDEGDPQVECGVSLDFWMRPRSEETVIEEDDETVTVTTEYGVTERRLKSPDEMSMPQHLRYPVQSPEDWQAMRARFDPEDPGRVAPDWQDRCREWRRTGPILMFRGVRAPSLFGFARELLGPEQVLYAFHDDPAMIHDMMECSTELILGLLDKSAESAPFTAIYFWEDMCYRSGPLISPAMFKEFMTPHYKRITERAAAHGIDNIFVDCDGDVSELIPLWLESGVNGVYPMEVAAGMDVRELRNEYGRDLLMRGGIDKRVLARNKRAIDEEVEAKVPLALDGGYLPHTDHAVPHDVPYEHFRYYCQRKKEVLGISG